MILHTCPACTLSLPLSHIPSPVPSPINCLPLLMTPSTLSYPTPLPTIADFRALVFTVGC